MSYDVFCSNWRIQLTEPDNPDTPARIRAQEEYLGRYIAPWLLDEPPWLENLESYHFIRYLDPKHLQPISGIAVVLRFLGPKEVLSDAERPIRSELDAHMKTGAIVRFESEPAGVWADSVIGDYGGPEVAQAWSGFLGSSSWLTLRLLRDPRHDFQARVAILANWVHCFGLVTQGVG